MLSYTRAYDNWLCLLFASLIHQGFSDSFFVLSNLKMLNSVSLVVENATFIFILNLFLPVVFNIKSVHIVF